MLVGQKKLLEKLDSYTIKTVPKTILFLGEEGCGKRTFAKYLANRLDLNFVEITDALTPSQLSDYQYTVLGTLYLIDLRKFLTKEGKAQNSFLKFIEEPGENAFIVLTANSEIGILPTILNRCTKIYFESYTADELKQTQWLETKAFDELYDICRTPGQVISTSVDDVKKAYDLSQLILDNIKALSYPRLLATTLYINDKWHEDRLTFELFLNTLIYVAYKNYLKNNRLTDLIIYNCAVKALQTKIIVGGLEEHALVNLLTNIYDEVQACN